MVVGAAVRGRGLVPGCNRKVGNRVLWRLADGVAQGRVPVLVGMIVENCAIDG